MTVKFIIPLAIHLCVLLGTMAPLHGAETPEDGKAVGAPGPHMVELPLDALSAKEVEDIYAFHAAYRLSQDGKLIAGKVNDGKLNPKNQGKLLMGIAGWCPTVHFSLGRVCSEDANYIIIVQLKHLRRQLIGLHPLKTVVLDDFIIPQNATLIVPAGEVKKTRLLPWVAANNIEVIERSEHLNIQVKAFLERHKAWAFLETKGNWEGKEDDEPENAPIVALRDSTYFNVTRSSFGNFLAHTPWVIYGPYSQHPLGFIEANAHYLLLSKLGRDHNQVPGGDQIKALIEGIFKKYIGYVESNSIGLEPYLTSKFKELRTMVLHNKQKKREIIDLYFGNTPDHLCRYAVPWIVRGNFHLEQPNVIAIEGYKRIEDEWVESYLERIEMKKWW